MIFKKKNDLLVSATPPASQLYNSYNQSNNGLGLTQSSSQNSNGLSKYAQLLAIIEEIGRDIRPTYAMGRGDRLKRLIIQAKVSYSHNAFYYHLSIKLTHMNFDTFSGVGSRMFNGN